MFNKEWGRQSFLRWKARSQCAPAIVTWHRLLPASSCLFIVGCGISSIFEGFRNYNEIYVVSNRRIFAMCNHCGCQLHQSHDIQGEASHLLPPFGRGSDYLWNQTVQTAHRICGFRTNLTIPMVFGDGPCCLLGDPLNIHNTIGPCESRGHLSCQVGPFGTLQRWRLQIFGQKTGESESAQELSLSEIGPLIQLARTVSACSYFFCVETPTIWLYT